MMEVLLLDDVHRFAALATSWMTRDPFTTNVIAVRLAQALDGSLPATADDLWIVVLEGDDVVGAAMHTPPSRLFLPRLGSGAAGVTARALLAARRDLPGVTGERTAVRAFSVAWSEHAVTSTRIHRSMRMYRLASLRRPEGVAGAARHATEEDRELVTAWLSDFASETDDPPKGAVRRADLIRARQLWLWWLERPVAMAAHRGPAAGVWRIGPVYTPPEHRRKGYGSAVTSAATDAARRHGADHVVLYSDLANPTSNSIYRRLGYVADHDAEDRVFCTRRG
jgi:predicted GNAT family acetyltransferase